MVYQTPGNRRRAANLARTTGMVGVVRDIVVPGLQNFQQCPADVLFDGQKKFEDDLMSYIMISHLHSFATHYSGLG